MRSLLLIFVLFTMLFSVHNLNSDNTRNQLEGVIGYLSSEGACIAFENQRESYYDIELLPGMNFTGSWYFWVNGEEPLTANLSEDPPVTWLSLNPSEFTDYPDDTATKVDYHFTTPSEAGFYYTTIIDLNGYWEDMYISLNVVEAPSSEYIYFYSLFVDIPFNHTQTWTASDNIYWEDSNQYYYYNTRSLQFYEYPNLPGFTTDPMYVVLPAGSEVDVTHTMNFNMTGNYNTLVIAHKELNTYPYYLYYDMDVTNSFDYGDIDDNGQIQAYDASLVLNYVVGNDPIPEIDPIPWEEWREERADVDLNEMIQAYDASLILNYVVGNIPELPWTERDAPECNLQTIQEGNYLRLCADGSFYSATLELGEDLCEANITSLNDNVMFCVGNGKLAIAASEAISGDILKIRYSEENSAITGTVNGKRGVIEYFAAPEISVTHIKSVYPNPFNPITNISFEIAEQGYIELAVFNLKGQRIEMLIDEYYAVGNYSVSWNAKDTGSGIYYLRLTSAGGKETKKLLLLK